MRRWRCHRSIACEKAFRSRSNNLQQAIRDYTEHAIKVEWPEMISHVHDRTADNPVGPLGMWALVAGYNPSDGRQSLLVDKGYDQLQLLTEDRTLGYMYGNEEFRR